MSSPTAAEIDYLLSLVNAADFNRLASCAASVARRFPASGIAWKLLGVAQWRLGKDPLPALKNAVSCLPNDAEAASNLGNALRYAGRFQDAVAAQQRALVLAPDYAPAHNNLGSALQELGRWEEAVESYRQATQLYPAFEHAHYNLGNALLHLGRTEAAVASFRRALQAQPQNLAALVALGSALRDMGNLEAAADAFGRALELQPTSAEMHYNLAVIRRLENRNQEAERAAQAAVEIDPKLAPALVLLAKLHADGGHFSDAEAFIQRAISLEPNSPQAWSVIPYLRRMTLQDTSWLTAARRIVAGSLPARQEMHLRYALGKYFDDVCDFPQAFHSYRRANELGKAIAPRHDRAQVSQFVEQVMRIAMSIQSAPRIVISGRQRPVFVIGMPRSGTSLVEQILASHPAVFGAGELPYWGKALSAWLRDGADTAALATMALGYRQLLSHLGKQTDCVVDKMPTNFLAVGMIRMALPDARFIHIRRDPIDTCLSIYFQDFESAYSYANDLADLVHTYRAYDRVMQHWRTCLGPDDMLEVPYEQLVADQEHWTRQMLNFVDLPFDPACLDFHRTNRTVSTVSSWQVRQAINARSVERWRNYREFISPLLALARGDP